MSRKLEFFQPWSFHENTVHQRLGPCPLVPLERIPSLFRPTPLSTDYIRYRGDKSRDINLQVEPPFIALTRFHISKLVHTTHCRASSFLFAL